ncbi:aminotransferase class I/II-fold pyridoxal phosphate-dependent enzyme [Streptomyces sp. NPDC006355]|uniref:aminotransferase class I/II-fold pyridoxal phosphate-dependent enzyme n=1 Tax=Streptomyces sp. NPDC006355 TaxID=3156758 RepID=UPI0033A5923E
MVPATSDPPRLPDEEYADLPCQDRLAGVSKRTRAAIGGLAGNNRAKCGGKMGGLAGLAVLGSVTSRSTDREVAAVDSMLGALNRRGPDGRAVVRNGSVVMGCTRPAPFVSEDEEQPFVSADGQIVLMANGEVHNHRELAASLPGVRLRTRSKREILLHLYEAEGLGFLDDVCGMFALVIHDGRRNEIVFARDRFGIEPMYHAVSDGRLVFASEPAALAHSGLLDVRVGREAGPSPTCARPDSFAAGVHATPAATIERVDLRSGAMTSRRFRELPGSGGADGRPDRNSVAGYRDLVVASVADRTTVGADVGPLPGGAAGTLTPCIPMNDTRLPGDGRPAARPGGAGSSPRSPQGSELVHRDHGVATMAENSSAEPGNGRIVLDPHRGRYAARTAGMTASEIRALFSVASRPEVVSLAGGMPNLAALPVETLSAQVAQIIAEDGLTALQYASAQGLPLLREQICDVMALEGITAHPDGVVVTVGSQMGLDLLTRLFCDPGDVVMAEGPSYVGALGSFAAYQARVVQVAMDGHGLVPEALRAALRRAGDAGRRVKLLYTIPNFHNPAGVTLAVERRAEILEICRRHNVLVVEDNPYGLLGFADRTYPALHSLDPDNVVYLGSFSKTFASGLRVGWVLAPQAVREKLVLATESATLCPPTLNQMIVSRYLATHDWQGQIKTFREDYRERRDAMLFALEQYLPPGCAWTTPGGGFYVWVTVPEGVDTKAMLPRAVAARVAYASGTGFSTDGSGSRQMRLSYCYPTPERIREGVRRLAGVLETELDLARA